MMRPSRLRRWLKWAGLIVSVLIAVAWAVSLPMDIAYYATKGRYFEVGLRGGLVRIAYCPMSTALTPVHPGGWNVSRTDSCKPNWKLYYGAKEGGLVRFGTRFSFWALSLWLPFVFVATPTAFLFWRDRRYPRQCCQKCGYNLTGNVSGRCPECGEKTGAPSTPHP